MSAPPPSRLGDSDAEADIRAVALIAAMSLVVRVVVAVAATNSGEAPELSGIVGAFALEVAGGALARWLLIALAAPARAATLGGLLYAVTAMTAPSLAGAALPGLVLGIEAARRDARAAVVVGMGVLASLLPADVGAAAPGFILAGVWTLLRLTLAPGGWDRAVAARVGGGGALGAALAVPWWLWAHRNAPAAAAAHGPPIAAWIACLGALAAAFAALQARAGRAVRWLLALWVWLIAARALGLSVASFLLDIAAPMPDATFLAAARPSFVLAVASGAALAWREAASLRVPAAGLAGLAALALLIPGTGAPPSAGDTFVGEGGGDRLRVLELASNRSLSGELPSAMSRDGVVRHFGIEIGTYGGRATGSIDVTLCQASRCVGGLSVLEGAADNAVLMVFLRTPLATRAGEPLSWKITHVEGSSPVAIWLFAKPGARELTAPGGVLRDLTAHIVLGYR